MCVGAVMTERKKERDGGTEPKREETQRGRKEQRQRETEARRLERDRQAHSLSANNTE